MRDKENLLNQAIELFNRQEVVTISLLQKELNISYSMAGNIIDELVVAYIIVESESKGCYVLNNKKECHEELYRKICDYCKQIGYYSISAVQREFNICYGLACKLIKGISQNVEKVLCEPISV